MRCIYCDHNATYVVDSRGSKAGVRRRRTCAYCKQTFTTTESALAENLFVVKKSGRRQRFTRDKLFVSIFTALDEGKYRDNGDLALKTSEITTEICKKILETRQRNIATADIIKFAHTELLLHSEFLAEKYALYSLYRKSVL